MTSTIRNVPQFERSRLETAAQIRAAVDEFERWGLILLTGLLPPEQVRRYKDIIAGLGDTIDRGWEGRFQDLVINDVLSLDFQLFDLVDDPLILNLVSSLLGYNIYVYMSEAISRSKTQRDEPGHLGGPGGRNPTGPGTRFHQDSDGIERDLRLPVAPRLSVKAGFYLTDALDVGCGNTWAVPGSHIVPVNDTHGVSRAALSSDEEIPILATAGDVLLFDRRLWHRGSSNETLNTRHAVFIGYAFRWLRPRFDTRLPEGIEDQSMLRRQLLGAGTTKGRYEAPESELPLRTALERQSFPAHPHTHPT